MRRPLATQFASSMCLNRATDVPAPQVATMEWGRTTAACRSFFNSHGEADGSSQVAHASTVKTAGFRRGVSGVGGGYGPPPAPDT